MIALLLAPIAGLMTGVVAVNIAHPEGFGWLDGPISRVSASLMYLLMMSPMVYSGMIVLGLPTSIWLTNKGIRSVAAYGYLGVLFGLLTPAIFINLMFLLQHHIPTLRFALLPFGVIQPICIGVTAGLAFWVIAIRQRGDTTKPSSLPSVPLGN